MRDTLPDALLEELSGRVAAQTGLHFPRERWNDLSTSVAAAAREQGQQDLVRYVQNLLSAPLGREQTDVLASHLTVGETYFFREKQSFDALEQQVLPELIAHRRDSEKRLRIWSAGCCTGEEPYSVAILLDRLIPDLADWNITILATDINPRFLETAAAGSFGEWSFRSVPPGVRDRYFSRLPGGRLLIDRRMRQMVTFSVLNLAEDVYPSLVNNTTAMDLVICRNVLMYFTPEKAARAVDNFHRALLSDGWLLAAPCETSQALFRSFTVVGLPGATFYRKPAEQVGRVGVPDRFWPAPAENQDTPVTLPEADALAADTRMEGEDAVEGPSAAEKAKDLANQGKLAEAADVCSRAISVDPLNASFRFLRAMVAQEQGMLDEAMESLRQALYLDQEFVMGHFALANLGKRIGRPVLWRRHFHIALGLLERLNQESQLPDSEGLSAGRLAEIIRSSLSEWTEPQ
jgi:chemotaxis protein methyltransferase CheR